MRSTAASIRLKHGLLGFGLILCLQSGHAAELEGVEFNDTTTTAGTELQLTSLSRLYYKVIFTGAVAGLYLANPADRRNILADVPKRLEFVYFGALSAADFVEAANQSLAENLDEQTLERLRPKIDEFNGYYQDIEKHDRYAISYIPGHGLQLALNGKVLGTVKGNDFANAYFHIWFGNDPFNSHLKTTLLNGNSP